MVVRIFETDPDARPKPKPTYNNEVDFKFRAGMMDGKKPVALNAWRVTTGDQDKADAIAQLMGGVPEEWQTTGDDFVQVLTNTDSVKVVIDSEKAVKSTLIQFARSGPPIHECDGMYSLLPDDKGEPCGCPKLLSERKAAAKKGRGPSPSTKITFRLAEDLELGVGQLTSSSWELLKVLHVIEADLKDVGEPALCELTLELVEYESKVHGKVSYRKPAITVVGPWNEAIAA